VRDEEVSEAELALEGLEEIDDLSSDADVEGGDGLVGDDKFWAEGEGAGDADALALASGELVRVAAEGGSVHADGAEEFGDALAARGGAEFFMDDERLGEDVFDAEAWVEGAEGILKDDLHVAAEGAEFGAGCGKDIGAIEMNTAGGGLDEAEDEATESAFAGAGFADEAEGFAGVNVEGDVVDGADFGVTVGRAGAEGGFGEVERFCEIADFDDGHLLYAPCDLDGVDRDAETLLIGRVGQSIPPRLSFIITHSKFWNME
jgi:hypothetical protein